MNTPNELILGRRAKNVRRNNRTGKKSDRRFSIESLEARQLMAADDPFSADAPMFDTTAPEPTSFQVGDHQISERTGAANYNYSIDLPPGRLGMEPNLNLNYSSRAPLRGGLAAGWSLNLPSIELDTSSGTLDERSFTASLGGATGRLVETSEAAKQGGTTYRVQNDDTFTIFEQYTPFDFGQVARPEPPEEFANPKTGNESNLVPFAVAPSSGFARATVGPVRFLANTVSNDRSSELVNSFTVDNSPSGHVIGAQESTPPTSEPTAWLARTTDGVTHFFGTSRQSGDGTTRWHLDKQTDLAGNTIRYNWEAVKDDAGRKIDYAIKSIEYTSNPEANLDAHARVIFEYADLETVPGTRTPIGSSSNYRSGYHYNDGALRLTAIETEVRDAPGNSWRAVRRVELSYDMEALGYENGTLTGRSDGAPLRFLTRIDVTAYAPDGSATPVPPVTFQYGDSTRSFDQTKTIRGVGPFHHGTSKDLLGTLLDIDGDGLMDRVEARVADGIRSTVPQGMCELVWSAGLHGGGFSPESHTAALPSYPWAEGVEPTSAERCTLMGQYSMMRNRQPQHGANVAQTENLLVYHFTDVDGDGDDDLMTALHYDENFYDPFSDPSDGPYGSAPIDYSTRDSFASQTVTPTETEVAAPFTFVAPIATNQFSTATSTLASGLFSIQNTRIHTALPRQPQLVTKPNFALAGMFSLAGSRGGVADPPGSSTEVPLKDDNNSDDFDCFDGHNIGTSEDCQPELANPTPGKRQALKAKDQPNGFVWRVYENTGHQFVPIGHDTNGDGRPDPTIAPVELQPTGNEDVRLGHGQWAFQDHAIIDFDGDGNLDILGENVHGDGKGGFVTSDMTSTQGIGNGFISYAVTHDERGNVVAGANQIPRFSHGITRLDDINGDGLPDLLNASDESLVAHLNNGRGFDKQPMTLIHGFRYLDESKVEKSSGGPLVRTNTLSRLDVDDDGLVDLVDFRGSAPAVYYNIGGEFLPTAQYLTSSPWAYAQRAIHQNPSDGGENVWSVTTDYTDANGDGLRDLIVWENDDSLRIYSDRVDGAAPRRLTLVDNGSGGTVQFHYRSTSDKGVVARGSQPDRGLPHVMWVVDTMTLGDAHGPESETTYQYRQPVYGSATGDSDDPARFLGFREVTKTLPLGGQISREYTYEIENDARGRLIRETTFDVSESGIAIPVSERQLVWNNAPLFRGQATYTHATEKLERTFSLDASVAPNVLRQRFSYQPTVHPESGRPVLYSQSALTEDDALGGGSLQRRTISSYEVHYSGDRYQVLNDAEQKLAIDSGGSTFELVGATRTDFNQHGLPMRVHRQIDAQTWATTLTERDPLTGNVVARTKPRQFAEGGRAKTTFGYDAHQLFVTRTTNERGHIVTETYDVGTGALLERLGPNVKTVGSKTVPESQTWQIDGLGRVISHHVSVDDDDVGYRQKVASRTFYSDFRSPRRVREYQRIDFDGPQWSITDRFLDGSGRLMVELDRVVGPDPVTRYEYYPGGELKQITAPHPDSNDRRDRVSFRYERDSLGRATQFTRPDGNGVEIEHAGVIQRVTEMTGDGSGGTHAARYDALGRMVQLVETGGAGGPGIWSYTYDANDNMARIHDPDGSITTIEHDMANRRREITRGQRVWRYEYDLNGNPITEITPVPTGVLATEYTSSMEYDELDRIVRRTPASRGMTDEAMNQLGIGTTEYHYDGIGGDSDNAIGRLTRLDLPLGQVTYTYDFRGLTTREERSFSVDHLTDVSVDQWVEHRYNALGQPTLERHDDGTQTRTTYDIRGLVDSVEWFDPGDGSWQAVADYDRSLAGNIKSRNTDFSQVRQYTYDALGRPTGDVIYVDAAHGPSEQLSQRTYTYSDSGDLASVAGSTLGKSASAHFQYDGLHRVVRADGPNGYEGEFQYSLAGNVQQARVDWNGAPISRDVRYEYGSVDAQAVDALMDQATDELWARFTYDEAGNMLSRTTPEGSWGFTWDGNDHMREADGPDGREAYYYDHEGQRMLAVTEDGARFWFGSSETHFDADGQQTRRYTHIADPGGTLARVDNGGAIELHYADALQNLMLTVSAEGVSTGAFLYGAFGEVVDSSGGSDHTRRFNGKEDDAVTGLRYYGFRYYDPLTLRWNSADPLYTFVPDLGLTEPQRMNLYAFSLNNPLRYYDPDGRDSEEVVAIDGAGASCESGPMICEASPERLDEIDELNRLEENFSKLHSDATESLYIALTEDVAYDGAAMAAWGTAMRKLGYSNGEISQEFEKMWDTAVREAGQQLRSDWAAQAALVRAELNVNTGMSLGAIAAGVTREFGSRQMSVHVGNLVNSMVDIGSGAVQIGSRPDPGTVQIHNISGRTTTVGYQKVTDD